MAGAIARSDIARSRTRSRARGTAVGVLAPLAVLAALMMTIPAAAPAGAVVPPGTAAKIPAACSTTTAIDFGSATGGSIATPGQADCYTFRAGSGRRVIIRTVPTGGTLAPETQVFNGDSPSPCPPSTAIESACRLVGGAHTIMVSDASGTNTGSYVIYAQLDKTAQCTGVRFGHALTGSIAGAGLTDCFKFRGLGGDHMRIAVVPTGGTLAPDVEVLKPGGLPLCESSTQQEQSCRLPSDGAYTVMISDVTGTGTGSYTVYVQRLDGPLACRALNLGDAPLVQSITLLGNENCFTFPGTTKQRVKVVVLPTAGAIVPNTEVIRPDGVDACAPTTNTTNFHCLLGGAGTYTLLIRDLTGTNTGSYSVAVSGL
jgi:hypothetical protein